jgi:putative transposase
MPRGLKRYQESGQSHFVTFSCYRRQPRLGSPARCDLFVQKLEQTRRRYALRVYGYVVMPEHVHLLVAEPDRDVLATALQSLKLAVSKGVAHLPMAESNVAHVSAEKRGANVGHQLGMAEGEPAQFWQKRYYDRNVRDHEEFVEKLRYMHRNPVKRGLVERPEDWPWSSFRHYATGETGVVEIESEWTARRREREPG